MFNEENLVQLETQNFDYIVGARIKNRPLKLQQEILDKSNYSSLHEGLNEGLQVARLEHKGRTLVVTHSDKRARKDKFDRDKGIAKLNKQKSPKDYLSNQGYKKYLTLEGECDASIVLNEEKLAQASVWDGLKGLVVSHNSSLSDSEIIRQYNNL